MKLNQMIDHTILGANVSQKQIDQIIHEAETHTFQSLCINPIWVRYVKERIQNEAVLVCTVVGFPHGTHLPSVKRYETEQAILDGADEIDMVINVGALKDKRYDIIHEEIKAVVEAAEGRTVKVILETCYLTDEEIVKACEIAVAEKADFVKTSTGFGTAGATEHHVRLMRETVKDKAGVKASGGIRTYEDAMKMIEAGANRIGTSRGIQIIEKGDSHDSNTSY